MYIENTHREMLCEGRDLDNVSLQAKEHQTLTLKHQNLGKKNRTEFS